MSLENYAFAAAIVKAVNNVTPQLLRSVPRYLAASQNHRVYQSPSGQKAKHLALANRSLCSAAQQLLGTAHKP